MYISRVKLENIRGFSGARNVDLTLTRPDGSHAGWTVLAGRNGSGKTSLLRAIAFAVGGPNVTAALNHDFRTWVSTGQHQALSEVRLIAETDSEGAPSDWGIDNWSASDKYQISELTLDLSWITTSERGSSRPSTMPLLRASTSPDIDMDGPWEPDPWGWFCAAYGPFRRLVGGASEAQRLMSSPGPVARLASLFQEDASLAEGVQWLIDTHLRALEDKPFALDVKEGALQVLADGLFPDDYEICDIDSAGLWVQAQGERFPLREMSDGYRTIAALVVDLIKQLDDCYGRLTFANNHATPVILEPGVVLIDEVDAHLHVTWQQRIAGWLKAHFPNIQFIVTTHSPYICQAADPGGLIRLPGPDEGEPPQVVAQDLYDRVVYGSGDDAVLSELFGVESLYSERAEELRREVIALEIKVLADKATESETERYLTLRRQLNSSPSARADEMGARLRSRAKPDE